MPKAIKYRLLICLTTFCLGLLLFTPITKNAHPQDKPSVSDLINVLKDESRYPQDRKDAAVALGNIGPEAKAAVPALIEALKDKDETVRKYVLKTLIKIGPEAVPALIDALKDPKANVRGYAAQTLGIIGPAAKAAVPGLIETLKDTNGGVRWLATFALGNIGAEAVPALIEALKDDSFLVRQQATHALGNIGPAAKAAVPALSEALKDENENVRRDAAWTLGKLATALRDAKATGMIKNLKAAKKALSSSPEFKEQENTVRRAIEYLEQIKLPWWKNIPKWVFKNKLKSSLILAYLLWVIIWLIVFWLHPLALLRINQAFNKLEFSPEWAGGLKLPARVAFFVGFLNYRPRVLDAWVKKHISTCRERFSEKPTVYDRKIHISVPVELNRQTTSNLTSKDLRPTFASQISCLLVWGEGGSGKTSLACQIAKFAMEEDKEARLCDSLMLPVLIEQELSPREDQSAFIHAVGRQLQDVTDQANPIPDELLERLLRYQRILVIVDHLSEMSDQTRKLIDPGQKGFPVNALLVTSRLEENLGRVSTTAIKPLRVAGDHLSSFMEAYLRQSGKRDLFTDKEFFDGCGQLSEMVGERDITLFFAKLYAEQMIASKDGVTDEKLPDNIPDLMLNYLNELNRNVAAENKVEDRTIHRDAKTLAWESIKEAFHPGPVRFDDAVVALAGEDAETRLKYLEDRLRLIKTDPITKDRLSFDLDPLAEYLSGLYLLEFYSDKDESWKNFLAEADKKQGAPEAIKGFLLAVRDCIITKGQEAKVPDFVADELAKRAGLDIEVIKQAQKGQRIQRLINQLSSSEVADLRYALEALGRIGPEAKAAVPALIEALKDEDQGARKLAARALGEIGPEAKAAVPALIEALKDENENVRQWAAWALLPIGPEAKAAVPALIEALKDEYQRVRVAAGWTLREINTPEALKALKNMRRNLVKSWKN